MVEDFTIWQDELKSTHRRQSESRWPSAMRQVSINEHLMDESDQNQSAN
jgi:hypothetical protein